MLDKLFHFCIFPADNIFCFISLKIWDVRGHYLVCSTPVILGMYVDKAELTFHCF